MSRETRYYVMDLDSDVPEQARAIGLFGMLTVGVVDEDEGGIIAYAHAENADRIVDALRRWDA